MRKIIEKNYYVKAAINKKVVVISDIHYYNCKDKKKLTKVLYKIKLLKPDFICIPGDLVDEAKIYDENELINWLSILKDIAKVIISLGNHELFITKKHVKTINQALIDRINKIDNVVILDNTIYKCDNINFIGITMPFEYYYQYNEDKNYFIDFFNKQFKKIDGGYNILLCHSPISISKREVLDNLIIGKKLDLILCGHMHGGITPNFLKKFLKGRGLISPRRTILQRNCYGYSKINRTHFVISSGITIASHLNRFKFLDTFFSSEISVINLH